MIFGKRFFIISVSSILFLTICDKNLLAVTKKRVKQTKAGRNAKKRSAVPDTNIASQQSESTSSNETTSTVVATPTTTTTTTVQQANTAVSNDLAIDATPSAPVEPEEITVVISEDQQLKTVTSDEKWEDFKLCMQQQCMGGPEQPLNVECYKLLNFDNAFQSCKIMIGDGSKYKLFERYFKEVLLVNEQEKACQTMFSGQWNKEDKVCNIEITFTRKYSSKVKNAALKNDKVGCNDNKKKIISISATKVSNTTCSYNLFGLNPCYSDPPNATTNEIGFGMGIATVIVGSAAGAGAGLAAAFSTKGEETYDSKGNVNGHKDATGVQMTFNGISAGMQMGNGMIMDGVGNIVQATTSAQDVGPEVKGACKLPDGTIYQEGSIMQIAW